MSPFKNVCKTYFCDAELVFTACVKYIKEQPYFTNNFW